MRLIIFHYAFPGRIDAGPSGLLPKDLAAKPVQFKVTQFHVSRRIIRMNESSEKEFGESAAEKRR